jgi:hypothetical protein
MSVCGTPDKVPCIILAQFKGDATHIGDIKFYRNETPSTIRFFTCVQLIPIEDHIVAVKPALVSKPGDRPMYS